MKNLFKFSTLAIVMALVLSITSCKKKKDQPAPKKNGTTTPGTGGGTGGGTNNGGGTGGGTTTGPVTTIQAARGFFKSGEDVKIPADSKISGVVISSLKGGNNGLDRIVIQNGEVGVTIKVAGIKPPANHGYSVGDVIEVSIGGKIINDYSKSKSPNINVEAADIKKLAADALPAVTPKEISVADLKAYKFPDVLVTIKDAEYVSTGTFMQGTKSGFTAKAKVGSDEFNVRFSKFAKFATQTIPTDKVDLIGISAFFFNPQLLPTTHCGSDSNITCQ